MTAANTRLIETFYDRVWNAWDADCAREILTPDISFRGSLGVETRGHDAFLDYVALIRAAFPDFHNAVDDIVVEGARAAARLTYTGTHKGELFGIAGTGRAITYAGAGFFRFNDGRIAEIWILGDRQALMEQITG